MIYWKVTEQEADVIMTALAARPYAEVANLIVKLVKQAKEIPMETSGPADPSVTD